MKICDKILSTIKKWIIPISFAFVVVMTAYVIWLFTTTQGKLTIDKFIGVYTPPPAEHTVSVYNDGTKIAEYKGRYSIERFDGHVVLVNHDDNTKVEIYGDSSVILDRNE